MPKETESQRPKIQSKQIHGNLLITSAAMLSCCCHMYKVNWQIVRLPLPIGSSRGPMLHKQHGRSKQISRLYLYSATDAILPARGVLIALEFIIELELELSIQRILQQANLCHRHRSSRDILAISARLLTSASGDNCSPSFLRCNSDVATLHHHCNSVFTIVAVNFFHCNFDVATLHHHCNSGVGDGYLQFELNWNASLN